MANLGTLTLDLVAKIGGFTGPIDKAARETKKSMAEIEAAAKGLGIAVGAGAAAAAGALALMVKSSIDAADEASKMAQSAGITTESFTGLQWAFSQSGLGAGDMATAFTKLNSSASLAASGSATHAAMYESLGVSVKDAAGNVRGADDILSDLADSFKSMPDGVEKSAAAIEIFGRSGAKLLPALNGGAEGIAQLVEQAGKLGLVISDEQAKQSEQFNDALSALGQISSGVANQIAKELLPSLTNLAGGMVEAATEGDAVSAASGAIATAMDAAAAAASVLAVIMAGRVVGSLVATSASFVLAQKEAIRYQLALAAMSGVSTRAAIGITAAGVAARGASVAMALLGGPVGAALLAASAVAYFATRSSEAEKEAEALDARIGKLDSSFTSLTVNQAGAAIQDYSTKLGEAELTAQSVEAKVFTLNDNIKRFPGSPKQEQWQRDLVRAKGELDTASQAVDDFKGKIEALNAVVANASLAPASAAASASYTDLSAKLDEQLLLVDKKTNADKLAARIGAGLIVGLIAGEGDLLIAKQKALDAAELAVAAEKDRESASKNAARAAASAAQASARKASDEAAALQQSIDALSQQADQVGWTSDAIKLYGLSSKGATDAQLAQADAALKTVSAFEAQTKAIEDAKAAQDNTNSEALSIADSLMGEEESIQKSYERRRQIILDNTAVTGQAQSDLLLKLEEQKNSDLLEINGSYWEQYLAASEAALTSFDDLAASVVDNFSSSFGSSFESMIFDAQTLEESVSSMAEGMARSVVNALGQMAAQWLAYQVVQMLVGKTTQDSAAETMTANAAATSAQAVLAAFASTAAIPIVGPIAAPAAAAAAAAATAPMVAAVSSFALAGMAHDGIDSVPADGTWLLQKGERVTTAETSAKLDGVLSDIRGSRASGSSSGQVINISMPGITNAKEAREASGSVRRSIAQGVAASQRNT